MEEYDGRNAAEVKRFVRQAVRLPGSDLETIRRNGLDSSSFHVLMQPVCELARGGGDARADTEALHGYILRLATEATADRPANERNLNPEWVAEAVQPRPRSQCSRELLENRGDERRARAYRELTALFRGKVKGLQA